MFPTLNQIKSRINFASVEASQKVPYGSKVLLSNQIENDLESVLRPLNLMQALCICSKYKVHDKAIMPNSITYNFIGVTCMLLSKAYYLYGFLSTFDDFRESLHVLLKCFAIYDHLFFSFGFILTYFSSIKNSYKNVLLISRIQHALTLLKINSGELRKLKIYNWISVISINIVFIMTSIFYFRFFPDFGFSNLVLNYSIIIFDLNIMYSSFVMKLLCKLLIVWIEDVRRAENISDVERESYWKIKYDALLDIMEAYKLVEKTFHQLFSLAIIMSQIWLMKSVLIGVTLSENCEKFYEAMDNVQGAVILLMYSTRCSDKHTRSVCKNIQRVKSASFKKMNVCGLFIVDAMMSLRLFSFITTYSIVLIQFKFL